MRLVEFTFINMSETSLFNRTDQSFLGQSRVTRREFISGLSFLLALRPQEKPPVLEQKKETGIIQTGLKTVEIKGKKYEIKINQDKFIEMILYATPYFSPYGEDLPSKVKQWFSQNALEIQIYDAFTNPLMNNHEGFFTPAEVNLLSDRTVIGIRVDQIRALTMIKAQMFDPFESIGDPQKPFSVLAHETGHFLEYVRSPQKWLKIADGLKSFLRDKIVGIGGSLVGLGLGLRIFLSQMTDKKLASRLFGTGLVLASATMLLQNLTTLGTLVNLQLTQGIEADEVHNNYFLPLVDNLGRKDFDYQSLVYKAIEFNPL